MDTTKFYFGELEYPQTRLDQFAESDSISQSKRELLIEYIDSTEPVFEQEEVEWRFGRYILHEDYVIGKFGKVFDEEPTRYDSSIGDFVTSKDGEDADVSYFVLFFDLGVIAFNRKHRIGPKQFVSAFSQGYNEFHEGVEALQVTIKKWEETFDEILERADRVFFFDFDLETTNPGPTDEMEAMDNRFKEAGADEFSIEMEAENSIHLGASVVRSAVDFVRTQYGNARVKFERDNREEEYNTKSKTATKTVEEPEELEDVQDAVDSLYDQITGITMDDEYED